MVTSALGIGYLLVSMGNQMRRGYINKAALIYSVIAIPIIAVSFISFLWLGLFDAVIARFQNDSGSALSRHIAFDLMLNMSFEDLWFGLPFRDVLNLVAMQAKYGLLAIEISWVNFILVCGLVFTVPLFIGYVLFLFRFLSKYCGTSTYVPAFYVLIMTATSNGIWAKSTTLATSLMIIISFCRKESISEAIHKRRPTPLTGYAGIARSRALNLGM